MVFNLIDILMVVIVVLSIFLSLKRHYITGAINLIGIVFATFLTAHYYVRFGYLLNDKFYVPEKFAFRLSFIVIACLILVVFRLVQEGWQVLVKIEKSNAFEKLVGFVVAVFKTYFICGLIFLGLLIVGTNSIYKNAKTSVSARIFLNTSVDIYKW